MFVKNIKTADNKVDIFNFLKILLKLLTKKIRGIRGHISTKMHVPKNCNSYSDAIFK